MLSRAARTPAAFRLALCLLFWLGSPALAWASLTSLSSLDTHKLPDLPSRLETAALEQPEPECVAFCAPVPRLELEASTLAGRVPDSWHPFGPGPRDEGQNQALFAPEWGSGIVNYANDNPTRFVDPTGHAAVYPEDVDSAEESVGRIDEIKRVIDAGGLPTASGSHIGITGGYLSRKYGAGARERVRALREGGFSKAAVIVVEESDMLSGTPDVAGLYRQFLHSAGGLASEITGLEQAFAEQVGGAKAGDAIDLSELYSFANDYTNSRIDQTISSLPGNFITKPIRQTWTVLGLGDDAPVDRRMDAAVSAGLDVAGGAALGRVLYRAGAGFALGFKQGLSGQPKSGVGANRAAGNAARDFIAEREAPALTEQNLRTTGGLRRLDVLKEADELIGIESKVGRTGLTAPVRQELARDMKLLRSGQLDKVRWEFWKSARTGQGGPNAALRQKLEKLGVEIVEHDKAF